MRSEQEYVKRLSNPKKSFGFNYTCKRNNDMISLWWNKLAYFGEISNDLVVKKWLGHFCYNIYVFLKHGHNKGCKGDLLFMFFMDYVIIGPPVTWVIWLCLLVDSITNVSKLFSGDNARVCSAKLYKSDHLLL